MFARAVIACALAACSARPSVEPVSAASAQTIAFRGEPGDAGPRGPTASVRVASPLVIDDANVVALGVPAGCDEGELLNAAFACEADDVGDVIGVTSVAAGDGLRTVTAGAAVAFGLKTGTGATDVAAGSHAHYGARWEAGVAGRGFSIVNTLSDDDAPAQNPLQYAILAQGPPVGTDFDAPSPIFHASIIGRNRASGGVGVLGVSDSGGAGALRVGVAGYGVSASVYGRVTLGGSGVHARADTPKAVALRAHNESGAPARLALVTSGLADFGAAGITGLIRAKPVSAASNFAYAECNANEIAIGGNCSSNGALSIACIATASSGACLSNTEVTNSPRAYFCQAQGATTITTTAICLKTSL